VLCFEGVNEDFMHLLFSCDFSLNFWWKLNMEWNTDLDIFDMLLEARKGNNLIFLKKRNTHGWMLEYLES
jgi:hypothetical protein